MAETPVTDEPRARRNLPSWAQGLLLAIAGIVLALGGCVAIVTGTLGAIGDILFGGGLFAVLIGGLWFLVDLIQPKAPTRLPDGNSHDE